MVTQDTRSSLCSKRRDEYVWPNKNRRSGASDHKKMENNKNKKSPRGIGPRCFPPPPRGANTLRSLKICAQVVESFEVGDFSNV